MSYNGIYSVVDDLSTKICFPSKTKIVSVKVFSMITRIYEAKTLVKHISYNCKCKSNQKCNNESCQRECKNSCKKLL